MKGKREPVVARKEDSGRLRVQGEVRKSEYNGWQEVQVGGRRDSVEDTSSFKTQEAKGVQMYHGAQI